MSSEQTPSGTSGNAPLYLIVSASTPVSMSGDQCGKVLVTPHQPQQTLQDTSMIASSTYDRDASLCGAFAVPPIHPQVALVNTMNNAAMSSKEIPGQVVSGPIRLYSTKINKVPTVQNENPQSPENMQVPHVTQQLQEHQPQPQVQSPQQLSSTPSSVAQQFPGLAHDSGSSVTLSNDEMGAQLLALLGALQQRQQQQQQQQPQQQQTPQPPQPPHPQQTQQQPQQQQQPQLHQTPPQTQPPQSQEHPQHHQLQQQPQHVILSTPSEIQMVDSPPSQTSHSQGGLPHHLKQMQQSIQSGQDMGQVLQAVLSQTAAMQGNLTTILTAITTLMQQQNQQQQMQRQMKQEQPVTSPPAQPQGQAFSIQQCLDAIPAFSCLTQTIQQQHQQPQQQPQHQSQQQPQQPPQQHQSQQQPQHQSQQQPQHQSQQQPQHQSQQQPQHQSQQQPQHQSQQQPQQPQQQQQSQQQPPTTSLNSSMISSSFLCNDVSQPIVSINDSFNQPTVHSSDRIYDPSVSFSQPIHSSSIPSTETSTVASNFSLEQASVKPTAWQSSLPPTSVPMDVDALMQQIFGDTSSQKFDPVLGAAKLDVQDSLVRQVPVMSAAVSNSHFVDSLLNQPPSQTEMKPVPGVERQSSQQNNGTNNSSGNSSTLRSLLTESTWLNPSSKSSDSIILNADSVSPDSAAMFNNAGGSAANRLPYLPSSLNEHIVKNSPLTNTFDDQTSQSPSTSQEKDVSQPHNLLDVQNVAPIQSQAIDEVSNHPTEHQQENFHEEHPRKAEDESQHSIDFENHFGERHQISAGRVDLSLRKAREGDSSGDESSPSCSPSSSRCGSPYLSRNSPDFMISEVICQDSDTQMSVIRRYHDMHIGSCSDSAMDELPSLHGHQSEQAVVYLPPTSSIPRSSSMASAKGHDNGSVFASGPDDAAEVEEDKDEMQPAAKQRRGINQTHVSDLCTTDEESNHGTYVSVAPWSSHVSSPSTMPADLSSDAGNAASPPLIVNQTPRLSGSGASLIMPVSVPTPEAVYPSSSSSSHRKIPRLPSLSIPYVSRSGPYEIKIMVQPEEQHRARYMTEGSRGAVKDRSGQGHPMVQLLGWTQTATLQVFVGTDTGRVKPHGFYQACKVSGKNSTPCKEKNFDGTNVIEIQFDPKKDMKLSIDCVGILKLRNADVEQRVGLHKTKKSTKARMVFRVNLPRGDGSYLTLQTFTDPILCTQPIGSPEISRISLIQASCRGGVDLFIIGKNFSKGTKVVFQELSGDNRENLIWEKDALVETEFLGQSHLICTIPPYRNTNITNSVPVQILVKCNGRISEPHMFTYKPEVAVPDQVVWNNILSVASNLPNATSSSLANSACSSASISTFVSPVAMELNKLVQVKPNSEFLGSQALPGSSAAAASYQLPLASPKTSCASPSAGHVMPGGPSSIVSSSTGPDSVASNSCVITGESGVCDLTLIPAMKTGDGDGLTSRESLAHSASVPGSSASANSPAGDVGVEHMDWSKLELPADLTGHSDDFNFLTELSAPTGGTEDNAASVTQKSEEPSDQESRQDGPFFMQ